MTTGQNGHAALVIFPETTGSTIGNAASPPAATLLPTATFNLAGVRNDRSLVVAYQPSSL